jgi:hypothetical protein
VVQALVEQDPTFSGQAPFGPSWKWFWTYWGKIHACA